MTAITVEKAQAARPAQNFVVVVFDGVSMGIMSFAFGVFDMAKHYGVLPDLDLQVVAGEHATAVTGGGLSCYVPYDLEAIQAASLIIIPNWRDPAEPPPGPLLATVRAAHRRGARVAGLCSGAFVLAAAGLLDGRPATTHGALAGQLAQMYPKVQVRADQLYIDDGDVLTAGGGAAGMDLGLHLLREHCGAAVANRLARSMVVPPHRPGGQAQYIESPLPAPDDSEPELAMLEAPTVRSIPVTAPLTATAPLLVNVLVAPLPVSVTFKPPLLVMLPVTWNGAALLITGVPVVFTNSSKPATFAVPLPPMLTVLLPNPLLVTVTADGMLKALNAFGKLTGRKTRLPPLAAPVKASTLSEPSRRP
jgi:hypothetical protein